jgi:hypothetical protein
VVSHYSKTDQEIYEACTQERTLPTTPDPSACHELLCRAFIGRSSDALDYVLEIYQSQFLYWVTSQMDLALLSEYMPHLEPSDILQDVLVKLFWRVPARDDCYERFPKISSFLFFIKQSIKNYEIDLLRQCQARQKAMELGIPPSDTNDYPMAQIDARAKEIFSEIEYLVYEHWMHGVPNKDKIKQLVGGELKNIKARVRHRLLRDKTIRELIDLPPYRPVFD